LSNPAVPLTVLLDEGAPAQVAIPFRARNHGVILFGDVLSPSAKDNIVAATAIQNNAILIAVDRDMRQLAKRWGNVEDGGRYKRLNLIFIGCSPVLAPKRVEHVMSFIEHEWSVSCQKTARTMWVTVMPHYITSYR
jgi:Domain of unknown function (DUF5615)